jgi:hypothetical protein
MKLGASVKEPIYFQLYYDKCFWCKRDVEEFELFVEQIKNELCNTYFIMLSAWVEGSDYYPHNSNSGINLSEHYWTMGWVKSTKPKCLIDRLPLPKYHAKKYNAKYKGECKSKYLMLDFYELG